jgi:hypothetical protein
MEPRALEWVLLVAAVAAGAVAAGFLGQRWGARRG